jgi:transposase
MTKSTRARYTLEFKEEAVRLVTGGDPTNTPAP